MHHLDRRQVLAAATVAGLTTITQAWGQEPDPLEPFDEQQRGDPDTPYETVRVDPAAIAALFEQVNRATFNPRDASFPAKLLAVAQRFVGMDRVKNEEEVASFLDLFDLPFRDKTGDFIPYCASGLTYAAALAYQEFWTPNAPSTKISALRESMPELDHYHFYPTPSVRDMYHVALGKRRWLDAGNRAKLPTPKPGYVVIYAFGSGPDHCGIVEAINGQTLTTIEFNTSNGLSGDQRNGGMVARRTRPYGASVKGFIATDAKA